MNKYPAPWTLKGYGYIILYRFNKEFINKQAPDFLKSNATKSFASLMLVRYEDSNCGPYDELLIIPGKYKYKQKKYNTISKIYVSSQASVDNGKINWGIPKQLAQFEFQQVSNKVEKITVKGPNDEPIFDARFKQGIMPFPVTTALLPFPLVQQLNQLEYYTKFKGNGIGRLTKMYDLHVNKDMFPDINNYSPILVIKVSPFKITFPKARIYPINHQ